MRKYCLTAALVCVAMAGAVMAQTSTFTYQGRLTDTSIPASGTYQMQFALYDAATGGTQIGTAVENTAVSVSGGVFTVQLDFGTTAFPGAERYLEISVRRASGDPYVALSPRQRITSSPYAIRALSAGTADNASNLGGTSAGNYVQTTDPRLSDPRTPTAGSSNYIQNRTTQQTGANFNVSGNGTAGGTLSGNTVNSETQYNIGGSRVLGINSADGNLFSGIGAGYSDSSGFANSFVGHHSGLGNTTGGNNSFFGAFTGSLNSSGRSNTFIGARAGASSTSNNNSFLGALAGFSNTTGDENSFVGSEAGYRNTAGASNSFLGYQAGYGNTTGANNTLIGRGADVGSGNLNNATAIGYRAQVAQSDSLVLGAISGVNGATTDTKVGIGTNAPIGKLDVRGSAFIGLTSAPALSLPVENSLFLNNDQGTTQNTFRLDGYIDNLYIVANSGTGSTVGAGIVFRTADMAGGEEDRVTILPAGQVRIESLGSAGSQSLCRNAAHEISTCSSSLRYKKNIASFSSGLSFINQLRPISYDWTHGGMKDVGLGAEDVATIDPLFVTYNAKGEIEGVKYDRLGVVFVNAFKEQQAQIEAEQERNRSQQSQIEVQQKRLDEQNKKIEKLELTIDILRRVVCAQNGTADVCKENK